MPRKHISYRESDVDRMELEKSEAVKDVNRAALVYAHNKRQAREGVNGILMRLKADFAKRSADVQKSQANDYGEPLSANKWAWLLSGSDFAAFVCYALRIELAPFAVAAWLADLRRMHPTELASLFKASVAAAHDEWVQRRLSGKSNEEDAELISSLAEITKQIERESSFENVDTRKIC